MWNEFINASKFKQMGVWMAKGGKGETQWVWAEEPLRGVLTYCSQRQALPFTPLLRAMGLWDSWTWVKASAQCVLGQPPTSLSEPFCLAVTALSSAQHLLSTWSHSHSFSSLPHPSETVFLFAFTLVWWRCHSGVPLVWLTITIISLP